MQTLRSVSPDPAYFKLFQALGVLTDWRSSATPLRVPRPIPPLAYLSPSYITDLLDASLPLMLVSTLRTEQPRRNRTAWRRFSWLLLTAACSSRAFSDENDGGELGAAGAAEEGGAPGTQGSRGLAGDGSPIEGGSGGENSADGGAGKAPSASAGRAGTSIDGAAAGEAGTSSGGGGITTEAGAPGQNVSGEGGEAGSAATQGGDPGNGGSPSLDCASDQICVPEPPSGWSGPAAVALAAGNPSCPSNFPTLAFEAGDGVTSPGGCECVCGELDGTCGSMIEVSRYSSGDCSGTPDSTVQSLVTTCVQKNEGSVRFTMPEPSTSCDEGSVEDNLGDPSFGNTVSACVGATSEGSCADGGLCLETATAPFDESVCVFRAGEYDCPAEFPTSLLVYENLTDGRSCPDTCTCNPQGGACRTSVGVFSEGGCSLASGIASDPECVLSSADSHVAAKGSGLSLASGSGECSGVDPAPSGTVTAVDPVTVCCME